MTRLATVFLAMLLLAAPLAGDTYTRVVVPSGDSVTSSSIVDDSIVNADVNTSAAIAFSKLAALTSGQILVGNGSNVASAVTPSGDVTLTNAGVATVADRVVEPFQHRPVDYVYTNYMNSTAGWTASNATLALDTTEGNCMGHDGTRASLKLTKTTTDNTGFYVYRDVASMDLTNTIMVFRLKFSDVTLFTRTMAVRLYLYSGNTTDAAFRRRLVTIRPPQMDDDGFVTFYAHIDDTSGEDGASWDVTAVQRIMISCLSDANASTPDIWFDFLGFAKCPLMPTPVYCLTLDDGYTQGFEMAMYALDRGLPVTFYVIPEYVGKPNFCTLAQLKDLQRAGALIALHVNKGAGTLSLSEVRALIQTGVTWMVENGFPDGARIMSYHGGGDDFVADAECSENDWMDLVAQARDTGSENNCEGYFNPRTLSAEALATEAAANAVVAKLQITGGVKAVYAHKYTDISQSDWEGHVDYVVAEVAAGRLRCATMRDLFSLDIAVRKREEVGICLSDLHPIAAHKDALPDAADGTSLGLADAAGSILVGTTTNGGGTASATETAGIRFVIPEWYKPESDLTVRVRARVSAARTAESLLDVVAKRIGDSGLDATDLCVTSATDIKAETDFANYDFTIDGDSAGDELNPGDELWIQISAETDDTGGSSDGYAEIASVSVAMRRW
ncbi:MAG: hypothetical protein GX616_24910 [Planctomycetes bacterium]|nr:hypothetical protein [Planctomycetota bacterium]